MTKTEQTKEIKTLGKKPMERIGDDEDEDEKAKSGAHLEVPPYVQTAHPRKRAPTAFCSIAMPKKDENGVLTLDSVTLIAQYGWLTGVTGLTTGANELHTVSRCTHQPQVGKIDWERTNQVTTRLSYSYPGVGPSWMAEDRTDVRCRILFRQRTSRNTSAREAVYPGGSEASAVLKDSWPRSAEIFWLYRP